MKPFYIYDEKKARAAANEVAKALLKKTLVKPAHCQYATGCTETSIEAHHPNYDKPLFVTWLCRNHHRRVHRAIRDMLIVTGFKKPRQKKIIQKYVAPMEESLWEKNLHKHSKDQAIATAMLKQLSATLDDLVSRKPVKNKTAANR